MITITFYLKTNNVQRSSDESAGTMRFPDAMANLSDIDLISAALNQLGDEFADSLLNSTAASFFDDHNALRRMAKNEFTLSKLDACVTRGRTRKWYTDGGCFDDQKQ